MFWKKLLNDPLKIVVLLFIVAISEIYFRKSLPILSSLVLIIASSLASNAVASLIKNSMKGEVSRDYLLMLIFSFAFFIFFTAHVIVLYYVEGDTGFEGYAILVDLMIGATIGTGALLKDLWGEIWKK